MILDVISSSFSQGVVWAVMAIGVYITFRLLDIADLSAEGVFPLGGAIAAILITNGLNPFSQLLQLSQVGRPVVYSQVGYTQNFISHHY